MYNNTKSFKELEYKEKLGYSLCITAFVIGTLLTVAGFFVPPMGEISGSVISVIGIFLSWSAAILGINTHYQVETEKFKGKILSTLDKKQPNQDPNEDGDN